MPYTFNYASIVQFGLEDADVETRHFDNFDTLFKYFQQRLDYTSFDGVYVASLDYEDFNTNEYPSALITRNYNELHNFLKNGWLMNTPVVMHIFECPTYEEALGFLGDCFETSSKAYNDSAE
jgi:hypothetical protein